MGPLIKISFYLYGFFFMLPYHRARGQIKGAYTSGTCYLPPVHLQWNMYESKLQPIKKPPQYLGLNE